MDRQSSLAQMGSSPPVTQALRSIPGRPPTWAAVAGRVIHHVMNDFGGGRRRLKLAWVINFQKLTTIPLLAIFMLEYHNFTVAAWIYTAMQSSYGLVWIIKDLAFPDPSFQKRATIGAAVASLITVLGLVLGVWLATDLADGHAKVYAPRLRLVQFMHKPLHPGLRHHGCVGCTEVLYAPPQTRPHYRWHVPVHSTSQLPSRNNDLRQLSPDDMALATLRSTRVGLGRTICSKHDSQRGQHVALCRVDVLQESFVVVAAANPLSNKFEA